MTDEKVRTTIKYLAVMQWDGLVSAIIACDTRKDAQDILMTYECASCNQGHTEGSGIWAELDNGDCVRE